MADAVSIRALKSTDLDALLDLYDHLHERDAPRPPGARLQAIWEQLQNDSRILYLGAFFQGVLVAASSVAIIPNLTRGGRPYGVIENVVTHAQFRRRGFGSRLLRALLEHCWAADCYKVTLTSAAQRTEAHALYRRLGFDGDRKRAFVISPT